MLSLLLYVKEKSIASMVPSNYLFSESYNRCVCVRNLMFSHGKLLAILGLASESEQVMVMRLRIARDSVLLRFIDQCACHFRFVWGVSIGRSLISSFMSCDYYA